jgi:ATP-GRASP peptide maturase of grasp-with-spasm system
MILILSQEENELTTELVLDWLLYNNCEVTRLNGENLLDESFHWELTDNIKGSFSNPKIKMEEIKVVWYRRWIKYAKNNGMELKNVTSKSLHNVKSHLKLEFGSFSRHFFNRFKNVKWFDNPALSHLNKLDVIVIANEYGLRTPKTLVTNNKKHLEIFLEENNRIITKPISEVTYFDNKDRQLYTMQTKEITKEDVKKLDEMFYPSLFQELIEKSYEIRTFYIDDKFYSMAIFSQKREESKIDFRNYSFSNPDKMVPFQLPFEIERKLEKIITSIGMTSCSIDLIKSIENEFAFLEINPVGQFGMVSNPCNYYLEKKVAAKLKKMSENEKMD